MFQTTNQVSLVRLSPSSGLIPYRTGFKYGYPLAVENHPFEWVNHGKSTISTAVWLLNYQRVGMWDELGMIWGYSQLWLFAVGSFRPLCFSFSKDHPLREFSILRRASQGQLTLWLCQNSYWKWPFIVDLTIKNCDFP